MIKLIKHESNNVLDLIHHQFQRTKKIKEKKKKIT